MNAQQVWLAQATEAPRISLEYIRHQASSLERGTRRRTTFNDILFVLAGALVVGFVWAAPNVYLARPLMAAAVVYYLLFLIYCTYRLHRHTAAQANTADAGVLDTLRFHRRQLERQRDFRRGVWRWTGLGMLPGLAMQVASMIIDSLPWTGIAFLVGSCALAVGVQYITGEVRARRSQREIDALDSLAGNA
jgi:hypothetical protein